MPPLFLFSLQFVQDVRDLLEHLNKQVPPETIDEAFETKFDKIFSPFEV